MGYIVRYIRQSDIDFAERWLGRRLTAEEIEVKKMQVRCDTEADAARLVDHLRSISHIAAYYSEDELR